MNPSLSAFSVSLNLTKEQYDWVDQAARFIANETGCQVSHSSIMMRLMENGLPAFEKELEVLRSRTNQANKRFHKLQLVYTRIENGT
jgi:hypothetical protein